VKRPPLFACRRRARGNALVEFAIILPVILALALGVVDFSRAIQFNNILVSLSREGANLAARTSQTPQSIISTLVTTAQPLQMSTEGMMYITKVVGRPDGTGQVEAQYRSAGGDQTLASQIWGCSGWAGDNSCSIPATKPIVTLPMALQDGETVYAVEAAYAYAVIAGFVMSVGPRMYAQTIL
jgi:TadE-like protein